MIAYILFALGRQSDISADLEQALAGKKLAGPAFHKAIDPVLAKYGAQKNAQFQRTVGDKRGLILTLAGSGPNWDSTKTWRVFLWPENAKIRAQVIKRFGDFTTGVIDSYTEGEAFWRGDQLIIAGKDYDGTPTSRAGVTSYQYENASWKLSQHLASERQGFAVFARLDQSIDPSRVMVRTRLRPENFRVLSEGPMLTFTETWQLKEGRYVQGKQQQQDTAIATLDGLAGYAQRGDHKDFDTLVEQAERDIVWKVLTAPKLEVSALAGGDTDSAVEFHFDSTTYTNFFITLGKVNGHWAVTDVAQG